MKNIEKMFERLKSQFDYEMPDPNHQIRFLEKLESQNQPVRNKTIDIWKPLLAVAASLIVFLGLFATLNTNKKLEGLASVSPELSNTQSFFTSIIESELMTLKAERSPRTNKLIEDALEQIELLEQDYEKLKADLAESGNDERVVYAMISNFQSRIEVLESVMQEIENIKQINLEQTTI